MTRSKTQEIEPPDNLITLNEYLANYSRQRNLDNPITLWYMKKDAVNTRRTKEDWERIVKKFLAEK